MMARIWSVLGAAALVATAACDNSPLGEASFAVAYDTVSVYALNGTPRTAATALDLTFLQPQPITASFAFDVAFDIDASGRAVLYPVQLISAFPLSKSVGLRVMPESFEAIERAPRGSYRSDSAAVVDAGAVVAVEVNAPGRCGFLQTYYGKLAIDSILPAERRLRVRAAGNPNCGFLSLRPGVPKE